jgi:hypothetical protein
MRWVRHVTRKRQKRHEYRFWVGNPEVKRPLGKTRGRWEDNVKVDLKGDLTDIVENGAEYIYCIQSKKKWWSVANMTMTFLIP